MIVKILKMKSIPPAKYISSPIKAFNNTGPVVGIFSTLDITTSPPTAAGNNQPIVLMRGFTAIQNGYLNRIFISDIPLLLAVVTYCFSNSSSIELLSILIITAAPELPRTINGILIFFIKS